MQKFKFTKFELINLCLAFLVLLLLFVSSSMTYQQQKMNPTAINHHFGLVERIIRNWNIYYAGVWHNRYSDHGIAGFTQFFVRKLAHFGSYFLLGMFSYCGLRRIFVIKWISPLFVWFMAIAMASFDEYHQYLTGGRTPSVHDVMLDASGAFCGITLCLIIVLFVKLRKKHC